jgi:hypothetical protein
MIKIKYGLNPQGVKEVEVMPHRTDNLVTFMKALMKDDMQKLDKWPREQKSQKHKSKKLQTPKPAQMQQPPSTPIKSQQNKKVWKVKDVQPSGSASPEPDVPSM